MLWRMSGGPNCSVSVWGSPRPRRGECGRIGVAFGPPPCQAGRPDLCLSASGLCTLCPSSRHPHGHAPSPIRHNLLLSNALLRGRQDGPKVAPGQTRAWAPLGEDKHYEGSTNSKENSCNPSNSGDNASDGGSLHTVSQYRQLAFVIVGMQLRIVVIGRENVGVRRI
jgi:hypothetical protein